MTAQSRVQLLFALWYGAIGILGNFFALYLKSIGISGAQIGFLAGVIPFASVLVGPVWAYFADVTQNIRVLLAAACLGLAISMLVVIHLRGFGVLLSCMLVVGVFHAPIAPFCNSLALQYLDGTLDKQLAISIHCSCGKYSYCYGNSSRIPLAKGHGQARKLGCSALHPEVI